MEKEQFFDSLPAGKTTLKMCVGTVCKAKGVSHIAEKLRGEIYILDASSRDVERTVTVETVPCLKACGLAPIVLVNGKLYGRLAAEQILSYLEDHLSPIKKP